MLGDLFGDAVKTRTALRGDLDFDERFHALVLFLVEVDERRVFYNGAALFHRADGAFHLFLLFPDHHGDFLRGAAAVRRQNVEDLAFQLVHSFLPYAFIFSL